MRGDRRQSKRLVLDKSLNVGFKLGMRDRARALDTSGQSLTGPERTFCTSIFRQEHDPVKSYGHTSLFNKHYLPERGVYAPGALAALRQI